MKYSTFIRQLKDFVQFGEYPAGAFRVSRRLNPYNAGNWRIEIEPVLGIKALTKRALLSEMVRGMRTRGASAPRFLFMLIPSDTKRGDSSITPAQKGASSIQICISLTPICQIGSCGTLQHLKTQGSDPITTAPLAHQFCILRLIDSQDLGTRSVPLAKCRPSRQDPEPRPAPCDRHLVWKSD
jgi:hypothetical protein